MPWVEEGFWTIVRVPEASLSRPWFAWAACKTDFLLGNGLLLPRPVSAFERPAAWQLERLERLERSRRKRRKIGAAISSSQHAPCTARKASEKCMAAITSSHLQHIHAFELNTTESSVRLDTAR